MKPIKPRFSETVKVEWRIPKQSKQLLALYAKYTKYDEDYIIERLIEDIKEDKAFTAWLQDKRYQKRIQNILTETQDAPKSPLEDLDF